MQTQNGNDQLAAQDNWRRRLRTERRVQDRRDALALIDGAVAELGDFADALTLIGDGTEELGDFTDPPNPTDCRRLVDDLRAAASLIEDACNGTT